MNTLIRRRPSLTILFVLHAGAFFAALAGARPGDRIVAPGAVEPATAAAPPVVRRFAPIVYLHPEDRFRPDDPDNFLRRSQLRWAHDELCFDHLVAAEVDAAVLGNGGYRHRASRRRAWGCRHRGAEASSRGSVRPRTRESGEEGFFLDLVDDAARRGGGDAPVLFYYVPRRFIAYWFFYPYNDGWPLDHEGDWENIAVRLDADEAATEIAYLAHGRATTHAWDAVLREGDRPIVFSARGSHASYPQVGLHLGWHNPDATARGPRWDAGRLRNVVGEAWWGYGGAWGEVGEFASTTGPKGPSPGKLGVPSAWLISASPDEAMAAR